MTVSEQIISVIDALCEKFGIAINWTSENVIPYVEILCKKLITYEIATSAMWLILAIAMAIIAILLTKKFYPVFREGLKNDKKNYTCGWEIATPFAICGLIGLCIVIIAIATTQIEDIIKCIIFPEMYVFEYVSNLIKGM